MTALLSARGLKKLHGHGASAVAALDDVDLDVDAGERVAVVGESGAGKSTLLRALVRLTDVDAGGIVVDGVDVTRARGRALFALRRRVQIVFQDPSTALHPLASVGAIVAEGLHIHGLHKGAIDARVASLLDDVGLGVDVVPRRAATLSGGQRQRVAIARALAVEPQLLLLDEPVAALDTGVAAQVINLLHALSTTRGMALLLVSHDLHVVRHVCTRALVMFAGRVVEAGDVGDLWAAPSHPYTRALVEAQPRVVVRDGDGPPRAARRADVGLSIAATSSGAPDATASWAGRCAYANRCPEAVTACVEAAPPLVSLGGGKSVRCHKRAAAPNE